MVEHETATIGVNSEFDIKASNERKSRLLHELNRAGRSLDFDSVDKECLLELSKLRSALERNEVKIKAHLSAIKEVSDIIVGIVRNNEADGTYSEIY